MLGDAPAVVGYPDHDLVIRGVDGDSDMALERGRDCDAGVLDETVEAGFKALSATRHPWVRRGGLEIDPDRGRALDRQGMGDAELGCVDDPEGFMVGAESAMHEVQQGFQLGDACFEELGLGKDLPQDLEGAAMILACGVCQYFRKT